MDIGLITKPGFPDTRSVQDPGVHPYQEWLRRGVSRSDLLRGLSEGRYAQPRMGWYAINGADPSAVTAVSKHGSVSCLTALRRHKIWIPPHSHKLHVRGDRSGHQTNRWRYCRQFGRPEPVREAIDEPFLALRHALRCLDHEGIVVVCDSLLNISRRALAGEPIAEVLTPTEVEAAFEGAPGHIRRCLDRCDARADSGTETMIRLRLRSKQVKVEPQVEIPGVGRVDALVGDRLIIEADGLEHHLTEATFRRDRKKDREAARQGLLHMRLTYRDVVYDWPETEAAIMSAIRDGHHRAPRRRKAV